MRIIKGTRISTSKGIHLCIGKWFHNNWTPLKYEFIKEHEEPMTTDVLIITAGLVDKMVKENKIKILC